MSLLVKSIQYYYGADSEILINALNEYNALKSDQDRLDFLLKTSYRVVGGPNYWIVNWKDEPVMDGVAPTKREAIDMAMSFNSVKK